MGALLNKAQKNWYSLKKSSHPAIINSLKGDRFINYHTHFTRHNMMLDHKNLIHIKLSRGCIKINTLKTKLLE